MAEALWAGLYCPQMALDSAWQASQVDHPAAVHQGQGEQVRLFQVNAQARAGGVQPGQSLASALAILPTLQTRLRQPAQERLALEQLAGCAYTQSHQVVLCPPDALLLEVGGSRRLRGGLAPLLDELQSTLSALGFNTRIGLAPFPATAQLFSRLGLKALDPATALKQLYALKTEQLALEPSWLRALKGCGLERLDQVLALPAAERARRFGPGLNDYLGQISGRAQATPASWQPAPRFQLRLELPQATTQTQALLFACKRALASLEHWLEVRDHGLTGLDIRLEREDQGPALSTHVSLSRAGFDRQRLLELIDLKLGAMSLPAAVQALTFRADSTAAYRPPQADLFNGHNRGDAWPALLDRLRSRIDNQDLVGITDCPDHRPEKAWAWTLPGNSASEAPACSQPRPSWLLPSPRPCRADRLELIDGPERIESGWWDGQDCRRDYWTAVDRNGLKLWVFEEFKPRSGWFIHGIFE
ncbi:MAG: Y-family DNA polymerase [Wenzhouxiangella sp.]